jgi:hypothetical protein
MQEPVYDEVERWLHHANDPDLIPAGTEPWIIKLAGFDGFHVKH